jgi:hypothetical protein
MRRDSWFGTAIFIFAVVFLIAGSIFIKWPDFQHNQQVQQVLNNRSVLDLQLSIKYDKPPIYLEQYTMQNNNGTSSVQYRVQGYAGKVVTVTLPPQQMFMVTFFFEQIVQDGIWQLDNAPPGGDTTAHYTLFIHQVADGRQGSRTITFTDPHYWAVTAGHQYQIELSPNGQIPDLTKLKSTTKAEPRYQQIVNAFRNFGPESFRAKVAQARASVASGT